MNVIQTYAPTNDKADAELEEYFAKGEEVTGLRKKGEITVIIGDFNSKIRRGGQNNVVGKYVLGERNDRGDRFIQFSIDNNFFVINTFFK